MAEVRAVAFAAARKKVSVAPDVREAMPEADIVMVPREVPVSVEAPLEEAVASAW